MTPLEQLLSKVDDIHPDLMLERLLAIVRVQAEALQKVLSCGAHHETCASVLTSAYGQIIGYSEDIPCSCCIRVAKTAIARVNEIAEKGCGE